MWKAFTLVETISILGIIMVIMTLSYNTLYSSLTSQQVTQATRTFIQDLRLTRIQAMNLQRLPGDPWIHGMGIDSAGLTQDEKNTYWIFKLLPLSPTGKVPTYFVRYPEEPDISNHSQGVQGEYPEVLYANMSDWDTTTHCLNDSSDPVPFRYVIFQTHTGKVFIYDSDENELSCEQAVWTFAVRNSEHKVIIDLTNGGDIYMETGRR